MPRVRITNRYKKFSNLNLLGKLRFIIGCISNNPHFIAPDPSIIVLTALADGYEQAISNSSAGGKLARAITKAKRKEVLDHLNLLANYILHCAAGSRLVVESSGFTIAKPRSTPPLLEKPAGLVLTDGVNAGELLFIFKPVKNAKSYIYQIAEGIVTEDTKWTNSFGSIRKAKFTNLESGKRYWVRVVAIGTNGQAVYSDAVSRIAQ